MSYQQAWTKIGCPFWEIVSLLHYTCAVINGVAPSALRAFPALDGSASLSRGQGEQAKKTSDAEGDSLQLSPEAEKLVKELKRKDQEVRAHEAAHMAAGGGLVRGGASYRYQRGPDGQSYAVSGEVSIDTSPVPNDPEATIRKAAQIKAAALAPAQPSAQDRAVAAAAGAMAAAAAGELAREKSKAMGQIDVEV